MKNAKFGFLAVLMAAGITLMAAGEGKDASRPYKTEQSMKAGLVKDLENFMMDDFNLDDVTVAIEFVVNKKGDLALVSVEGENCIVNTYVQQILRDKKLFVTEELSDKVHQVTIRYVRI